MHPPASSATCLLRLRNFNTLTWHLSSLSWENHFSIHRRCRNYSQDVTPVRSLQCLRFACRHPLRRGKVFQSPSHLCIDIQCLSHLAKCSKDYPILPKDKMKRKKLKERFDKAQNSNWTSLLKKACSYVSTKHYMPYRVPAAQLCNIFWSPRDPISHMSTDHASQRTDRSVTVMTSMHMCDFLVVWHVCHLFGLSGYKLSHDAIR